MGVIQNSINQATASLMLPVVAWSHGDTAKEIRANRKFKEASAKANQKMISEMNEAVFGGSDVSDSVKAEVMANQAKTMRELAADPRQEGKKSVELIEMAQMAEKLSGIKAEKQAKLDKDKEISDVFANAERLAAQYYDNPVDSMRKRIESAQGVKNAVKDRREFLKMTSEQWTGGMQDG